MKFKFLAKLALFSFIMSLLLIDQSYAQYSHTVYVKNNTGVTLSLVFDASDSGCIDDPTKDNKWPITVHAGEQSSFTYDDNDGAFGSIHDDHCLHDPKSLVFYAQTSDDSASSKVSITIQRNSNDDWESVIYQATNKGGLNLTSGTCGGNDCLYHSYQIWGDENFTVSFGLTGSVSLSNIKAIGLGEVSITNGFGAPAGQNGSLDLSQGPFVIRFSTSAKACTFNGGLLKCDPGIIYTYSNNNLIFMCQQTSDGQAKCPWLLESDGTGDIQYHANIYGK